MNDRQHLRTVFDQAAESYHGVRPTYPEDIFDAIDGYMGLEGGGDVLEVGPGSGIATVELAKRGHSVTAIELGEGLAAEAARNTAEWRDVRVIRADFEQWKPDSWGSFDAVVAATSWHWIEPKVKYRLAARHLRTGGTLAFWSASHVFPVGGDGFFREIQTVYDTLGLSRPSDALFPEPGQLSDAVEEVTATGLFCEVEAQHFDWERIYTADSYLALLDTFSGHIAMSQAKRDHLYGEIRRRLATRPDGRVRRHWGAVLHLSRRVDDALA